MENEQTKEVDVPRRARHLRLRGVFVGLVAIIMCLLLVPICTLSHSWTATKIFWSKDELYVIAAKGSNGLCQNILLRLATSSSPTSSDFRERYDLIVYHKDQHGSYVKTYDNVGKGDTFVSKGRLYSWISSVGKLWPGKTFQVTKDGLVPVPGRGPEDNPIQLQKDGWHEIIDFAYVSDKPIKQFIIPLKSGTCIVTSLFYPYTPKSGVGRIEARVSEPNPPASVTVYDLIDDSRKIVSWWQFIRETGGHGPATLNVSH